MDISLYTYKNGRMLLKKDNILMFIPVALFLILTISSAVFSIYLLYLAGYAHSVSITALAVVFLMLSILSGFFNIFTAYSYYRSQLYSRYLRSIQRTLKPLAKFPSVAIVMPVYNEDPATVKKNIVRLKEMDYPKEKMHIYLLDDSTKVKTAEELRAFSKANGIEYMHRKSRSGYKAGALNNFIKTAKEEYLAIFDYDEYLTDVSFLKELLPYFAIKNLSYVQTEKSYSKGTFFSETINLFDAFFFNFVQPSRALNNTAIFAGSCGIINVNAIKKIGGFPEYVIEDTFFSFESDIHKYKSLYVPKIYALGKPIKTFTELARQQWRYNYGDTQFLHYFFKKRASNKSVKLSALQNIDYLTHGSGMNYISVVLVLFTLVSVLIVFATATAPLTALNMTLLFKSSSIPATIEALGIMAFIVSLIAPVLLIKLQFKSIRKGIMVLFLNFALAITRTKAAIAALMPNTPSSLWVRGFVSNGTRVTNALKSSFSEITFASILFMLSIFAMFINNFSGAIWLFWYSILYFSTFAFFYKYG